ncbi:IclR family transcriptional regulator [candidate division KSB3 bacterium]|uniref:IclR family transcriptional regulator n=1 Tax=candidate division KSB3 bacterium TaxID=2044937 RepID=A0A2G6EFP2_9BACT|nr:MAG: IclR family transcriptional regulator [candidate division KSB3 bacterium]PIE31112.1 MAG: IclR family transcriptional regulator [candidate division KSB3 bacterium]
MTNSVSSQRSKPTNLIQTIERVSLVFDILALSPNGISLGDLAKKVNLPKGTTHRILASLMYFKFVRQNPETRNYSLGFKLVELGSCLLEQINLRKEAEPFLHSLSQKTGETSYLAILDGKEVVYVEKIESENTTTGLRATSKVGQRNLANVCSLGKVLLANLPETTLHELIPQLDFVQRTEQTISDPLQFQDHLRLVRSRGYAIDDEESERGIRCVAAPIRNDIGQTVAAVSVSGPAIRISRERIQESTKDDVMAAALEISKKLGFRPEVLS